MAGTAAKAASGLINFMSLANTIKRSSWTPHGSFTVWFQVSALPKWAQDFASLLSAPVYHTCYRMPLYTTVSHPPYATAHLERDLRSANLLTRSNTRNRTRKLLCSLRQEFTIVPALLGNSKRQNFRIDADESQWRRPACRSETRRMIYRLYFFRLFFFFAQAYFTDLFPSTLQLGNVLYKTYRTHGSTLLLFTLVSFLPGNRVLENFHCRKGSIVPTTFFFERQICLYRVWICGSTRLSRYCEVCETRVRWLKPKQLHQKISELMFNTVNLSITFVRSYQSL